MLLHDESLGHLAARLACTLLVDSKSHALLAGLTQVVQLAHGDYVSPGRYPRFTLLGQAIGSVRLAYEGLHQLRPEVCPGSLSSRNVPPRSIRCLGHVLWLYKH